MRNFLCLLLLLSHNTFSNVEWEKLLFTFPTTEGLQEISSPAMSYKTLIEWGGHGSYNCLIYRISSREKANGVLYKAKRGERGCSLAKKRSDQILYSSIRKLKVKLTKSGRGQSYQVIVIDKDGKESVKRWQFPFGDLKYSRWSGISIQLEKKSIGASIEQGKVCSYFDREAMRVNFKNCEHCRNQQWTPVLNRLSASYPVAICGARMCGDRNQNPCIKMMSMKSPISCEEAKKFVYCQSGKSLICLGSGFLECR
jgi:hypothetical protein